MRLTLLVPELIWPEPADQIALGEKPTDGLSWLEARARFSRQARQPFELALSNLFKPGLDAFAPLRLLGEKSGQPVQDGCWLCADPVHLRFHQERIILADAGAFDLDDAEAQALVASLNSEFADIGQFHVATSRRWYLRLNSAVDHAVKPISAVAGRRVDGELSGKNSPLTRWLNEVQMFLHGHPVNEARQNQGKPAVNSLWLWGTGSLPTLGHSPFDTVCTDNPLAIGLSLASGLSPQACPAGLDALLAEHPTDSSPLVVLDSLQPPVLYEDSNGWRRSSEALEQNWFAPLRKQLGRKIETLTLIAPTVYGQLEYQLSAGDRWKFWRKGRSPRQIAEQLAGEKSS
ncbi:hypothetical protein KI614_06590 [Dechloromonas denitrificans]|uniref:hypothetical protein n=1 Tax=Dechloromonas denitrificans TaxID=281362 RepID=UPI001CF8BA44|nr:hypothetical protein [Dechloromonas denitrificans]UCV12873.1 hypothetical protein KI614_06590 [Dechloromonas denitrificans]